jgi:hypothetical protein
MPSRGTPDARVVVGSTGEIKEAGRVRPAHVPGVEARTNPSDWRTISSPVKRVRALLVVPLIKSSWLVNENCVPLSMTDRRDVTDWVRETIRDAYSRGSTWEV